MNTCTVAKQTASSRNVCVYVWLKRDISFRHCFGIEPNTRTLCVCHILPWKAHILAVIHNLNIAKMLTYFFSYIYFFSHSLLWFYSTYNSANAFHITHIFIHIHTKLWTNKITLWKCNQNWIIRRMNKLLPKQNCRFYQIYKTIYALGYKYCVKLLVRVNTEDMRKNKKKNKQQQQHHSYVCKENCRQHINTCWDESHTKIVSVVNMFACFITNCIWYTNRIRNLCAQTSIKTISKNV